MGTHAISTTPAWGERMGDGLIRAWRTFYTSVGVDILVAIGVGMIVLLNTGDPLTPVFWLGLLALVVRSAATGIATYWARLKFPPKNLDVTTK